MELDWLLSEPLPAGVPAFPVAEGWTQRVGQGP